MALALTKANSEKSWTPASMAEEALETVITFRARRDESKDIGERSSTLAPRPGLLS